MLRRSGAASRRGRRRASRRPSAIASAGMPNTTHDCSSSAIVSAPAWRSATMPSAPSEPMPVSSSATIGTPRSARRRVEQHVDRGPLMVHARPCVDDASAARTPSRSDQHVIVAGRDVGDAALQRLVAPGFDHPHRAAPCRGASANARVKRAGMCCTIRIGGASAGRRVSTASIACVPPVDAPIAIRPLAADEARTAPAARGVGGCLQSRKRTARPTRDAADAVLQLLGDLGRPSTGRRASAMTSMAPARQRLDARRRSASASRELTMITGSGWCCHQLAQERQAVHARHLDVERDDVRLVLQDQVARDERIGAPGRPPRCRARLAARRTASSGRSPSRRRSARELGRAVAIRYRRSTQPTWRPRLARGRTPCRSRTGDR